MVFNRAAKKLLEEAAMIDVVLHDRWVYQLVSAGRRYGPLRSATVAQISPTSG
jgi:hypothetical protein